MKVNSCSRKMLLTLVAKSGGFAGKAEKQIVSESLIGNAGMFYYFFPTSLSSRSAEKK